VARAYVAFCANAGLDAQLSLGFGRGAWLRLGLILGWEGAARALGLNNGHGWQAQRQQKGKTA
jgi:hypothetical protein